MISIRHINFLIFLFYINMYFNINYNKDEATFIFNNISNCILWDYSEMLIPFLKNKEKYYNYQEILFTLLEFSVEKNITIYLRIKDNNPQININSKGLPLENIIIDISKIINDYIDSKFIILN